MKSNYDNLFTLTKTQVRIVEYLLDKTKVDPNQWAKDLGFKYHTLQTHLYFLRDKYVVNSTTELLEAIKDRGLEP